MEKIIVTKAEKGDISGILQVQANLLLDNLIANNGGELNDHTVQKIINEGFLVYPLEHNLLENLINKSNSVIEVVKSGKEIVGYIVLYDITLQSTDWRKKIPKNLIDELSTKKVLYGKHVAVLGGLSGKGVGTYLEKEAYKKAKEMGFDYLLVEIAHSIKKNGWDFANQKSMQFHSKHQSFTKIGEINYGSEYDGDNKEVWNLMIKKI